MIKIMHFCSDCNIGGAGITLYRLVSSSKKALFEHIVVLPENSKLLSMFYGANIRVITYKSSAQKSFSLPLTLELIQIISKYSPNIVHTHGMASARLGALFCGVKSRVYTRHTYREIKTNSLFRVLNNVLTTKAVAVSSALTEQIRESGIKNEDIVLIPNGCEFMGEAERNKEKNEVFTLLYHGRIEREKGLLTAVRAVCRLVNAGYNVRLMIVGNGEYKSKLKETVNSLGLADYVQFFSCTNDVKKYINMSDVALNCSYCAEGTSNSVIECMSAGVVPVLSSVKGNMAVVRHQENGLVFKSGSVGELTDCIRLLINDRELYSRLSSAVYETYIAKFTLGAMIDKYEKLWKDEYIKYYGKK